MADKCRHGCEGWCYRCGAPAPAEETAQEGRADIPAEVLRELMACAASNGRISVDYLCDVWRRGHSSPSPTREARLDEIARLVADDAWAITFQTMGQYRTAILEYLSDVRALDAARGAKCE
jgi:hypothetical protein